MYIDYLILTATNGRTLQVLYVAETISHVHIRSAIISGGECSIPQHVSSDVLFDLTAGIPSSVLQPIEEGSMAYDDIKHLVSILCIVILFQLQYIKSSVANWFVI